MTEVRLAATPLTITDAERAEIEKNRARYHALKSAGQGQAPKALPPATALDGAPIDPATVTHRETLPGGWYYAFTMKASETIRILNPTGTAAVSLLCWNRQDPSERLNHADTVKVQWTAALRKGRLLLSDMGRVLFSIVEDTSGAHDSVMGPSNAASNLKKYGPGAFRNTRDNFILAASKFGLDARDIPPAVTFFAPVSVDASGKFGWHGAKRKAGDFVDLRAEMDMMVALSNCPHPLDPAADYAPGDVEIIQFTAPVPGEDDLCRTASAEAVRAFENNAFAHLLKQG